MDSSNSGSIMWVNRWLMIYSVAVALGLGPGPRVLVLGCFTSIFNFGDSLSDTGSVFKECDSNKPPPSCYPPYGDTFFHRPTGRYSDGRLIIDFIAQSLGVPLLQPYLGLGRERISAEDFEKGLNFAVTGATALDVSYLREKGIVKKFTNYSLAVQLECFRNAYSSLCTSSSTATARCRKILKSSLFVVGEIGGNDYNYPFFEGHRFEEIKSLVPLVVKAIGSTITELIKLGAQTLMVPGNLPIGCNPTYLKIYGTSSTSTSTSLQDSKNGCLDWLNQFSEYHNEQLQQELKRIRARHPHVHIIYADYYNPAMRFFNDPEKFGFTNTLQICLVDRHEVFNKHSKYGWRTLKTSVCEDPSKYVSWDGIHLTEAAYRLIAIDLFTNPQISTSCISLNNNATINLLQRQ